MYRLGLRLTLRSGKEALTRLLVTMAAVAAGVTILLAVLADFHAFQYTNNQPRWQSTLGAAVTTGSSYTYKTTGPEARSELWNYSETIFRGQTIDQLDVAALGPNAPLPPGISSLPGAGQYYASPALAALIASTPGDQLGDRFPGVREGTIGDKALTGPDALVVYVGYSPSQLAVRPATIQVSTISSGAQTSVWTNYFRYAFAVGAVAFVLPILILIGMATRLAATRREERYAALRLVGATNRQIAVISSVDASVSALAGTLLGMLLFVLLRPLLADMVLFGTKYFSYAVTPTALGYLALLVCVPLASAVASLISLRRVRISPLGVTRRQTPPRPSVVRVIPLLLGVALFVYGVAATTRQQLGVGVYPGLLLTLIGLVVAGPWLTATAARLLARRTGSAPSLLAARRLADTPKAAFRAVSGLILAVFLGSMLAGLMPTVNETTATPTATALSNVLLDTFYYSPVCGNDVNCTGGSPNKNANTPSGLLGLTPATGAAIVQQLQAFHGVAVVPYYSLPSDAQIPVGPPHSGGSALKPGASVPPPQDSYDSALSCAALAQLPAFGTCAPGRTTIEADTSNLTSDNPKDSAQPIAVPALPAATQDLSTLYLRGVLVRVDDPTTLELVRTFLVTHTPLSQSGMAPRTFGESVQARAQVSNIVQRMMNIAVVLTLLVAGCSLAVAAGGSLVERKRPFTLLRLTGTPVRTLYKVVLLEALLPLAAATVLAIAAGYGLAVVAATKVAPAGTPIPGPGSSYYLTMALGLLAALVLISGTLPFLSRLTRSDNARFE
ncbi:FtsX-like permease family protein [Actinospica sp.]|uniref:FtsX-like permease family protein n=1 Tax=Actinospica sp. TaxID=1872142 RepID=UPI002C6DBFA9|nr:FtsX-like permease family protein [Actinospica sp.]HWG23591.1 FtsX-like permease family protein [Actinospica sp.]